MAAASASDKFNRTVVEFVQDLCAACPDSVELQMYAVGLRGLVSTAPERVQRGFYDEVTVPYGDRILARDEAFFLGQDYGADAAPALVDKIKGVYADLGEDDRTTIYKYLRILVLLTRKMFE